VKAWLVALALAPLAGCDTVADGNRFEKTIEETLAKKGIELTVDCPDRIRLGHVDDNHFRCDVEMTGTNDRGTIEVKLDGEGNLSWQPVDSP
jgi:hypothetical protein